MMSQNEHKQVRWQPCILLDDLVPQQHLLRKIDEMVNFSFIYDEVRDLYCKNKGRPSIDPVVMVKYLLIGFLDGIASEREIELRLHRDLYYRWFLRFDLDERVPDHSTISQLRRRKFNGTDLFRKIFERILTLCAEKGLVDGKLILTDSTHVKASASKRSEVKRQVERETTAYFARLDKYEEAERRSLEQAGKIAPKRRLKKSEPKPKLTAKTVSITDPDAGRLYRPDKPEGMHYLNHQSIDAKHGIIVDAFATAGNVADCVPYLNRIEHIEDDLGLKIGAVAVDSGYDTSLIHKALDERGIEIFTPKKANSNAFSTEFGKDDFSYDEAADAFTCPNGNRLTLRRLQRNESTITREYQAGTKLCKDCPMREKCLTSSQKCRRIQVNIFEAIVDKHHAYDGSAAYKEALCKRQIWSEGTFAAQKARHNLTQIFRRGIEAAQTHCLLSATAINLKRLVKCTA